LKNLRRNFERFCYQNRSKGIPNLMLYITVGTAIVYFLSLVDESNTLYYALCFDRDLILQGQLWRLITFVFTHNAGNILVMLISLLCYFTLGRAMENAWGTLRFNLFYLTGVVLMDIFCMLFGGAASVTYLNLSLFLSYATMFPDAHFLLFFIIPVKAWLFALIDLVNASGAVLVGCGVMVEKVFCGGGDEVRARGVRLESLAKILEMSPEEGIIFED